MGRGPIRPVASSGRGERTAAIFRHRLGVALTVHAASARIRRQLRGSSGSELFESVFKRDQKKNRRDRRALLDVPRMSPKAFFGYIRLNSFDVSI
jgi:hypothetical protein